MSSTLPFFRNSASNRVRVNTNGDLFEDPVSGRVLIDPYNVSEINWKTCEFPVKRKSDLQSVQEVMLQMLGYLEGVKPADADYRERILSLEPVAVDPELLANMQAIRRRVEDEILEEQFNKIPEEDVTERLLAAIGRVGNALRQSYAEVGERFWLPSMINQMKENPTGITVYFSPN